MIRRLFRAMFPTGQDTVTRDLPDHVLRDVGFRVVATDGQGTFLWERDGITLVTSEGRCADAVRGAGPAQD